MVFAGFAAGFLLFAFGLGRAFGSAFRLGGAFGRAFREDFIITLDMLFVALRFFPIFH